MLIGSLGFRQYISFHLCQLSSCLFVDKELYIIDLKCHSISIYQPCHCISWPLICFIGHNISIMHPIYGFILKQWFKWAIFMGTDSLHVVHATFIFDNEYWWLHSVCVCVFVCIPSMCKAVKFHEHLNKECVNVYLQQAAGKLTGLWINPCGTHTPQPHYPLLRASWVIVTLKLCVFPTPISVCWLPALESTHRFGLKTNSGLTC